MSQIESRLSVLEFERERLNAERTEFREAINKIAEALTLLARLEESHKANGEAIARAFVECEKVKERVSNIEIKMPGLLETRSWIITGMVGIVGVVGIAILTIVLNRH